MFYRYLLLLVVSSTTRANEAPRGPPVCESQLLGIATNMVVMEMMTTTSSVPSVAEARAMLHAKLPQMDLDDADLSWRIRRLASLKVIPGWLYEAIVWVSNEVGSDSGVDNPTTHELVREYLSTRFRGVLPIAMNQFKLRANPWLDACVIPLRVWQSLTAVARRDRSPPCVSYFSEEHGATMWSLSPSGFKSVLRAELARERAKLIAALSHAEGVIDRRFWHSFLGRRSS